MAIPDRDHLAAWHDLLGSEPHVAGTPGDARQIERLAKAFSEMGIATEVEPFFALLPQPISAQLEIVGGGEEVAGGRRGVLGLPLKEDNLLEDPSAAHPGLTFGWNAYSASGDVTAEVVYANYGTRADFEQLRAWGVDCAGKIVLARYGGNFRGYKARFAAEAGAAGLVMYTDPADGGFTRGEVWPAGGWANDTCVQRGSVGTPPFAGDPLTPGVFSAEDAPRLSLDEADLPRIPVQPIGYRAAAQIISRMAGREVPADAWRGGLSMPYRLEGGPALELHVKVEQDREIRRSANVVARIAGRGPGTVIIGCHHDAWGFGAADPLAGTIVLMESARALGELAESGWVPEHSILFCAWGAEEYGMVGSGEWVEAHEQELLRDGIAYINLDMAAMGRTFSAGATPSLREALQRASRAAGLSDAEAPRSFGDMGGGSDHVGFVCRVGIPSVGLSTHGAPGTSYHSNYDTVKWYRATVGEDYAGALLLSRVTIALAMELACRPSDSIDPAADLPVLAGWLRELAATDAGKAFEGELLGVADAATRTEAALRGREWSPIALRAAGTAWLDPAGIDGRPWYRSLYISADPVAGYGAQPIPLLADAIRSGDPVRVQDAVRRMVACLERLEAAR